jgi:hypothetical protein
MRWARNVASMRKRNVRGVSVEKLERKRQLGRSVYRSKININIDIRYLELCILDGVDVAQVKDQWRAVVTTVMKHRVT